MAERSCCSQVDLGAKGKCSGAVARGRPVALKHDGSPFDKNRLNSLLHPLTNPCFSKSEKLWIIKGDSVEVQVWRKSSSFEMIQSDVAETSVDPRVSRNSEVSCLSP